MDTNDNKRFWQRIAKVYGLTIKTAGSRLFPTLSEAIAADWDGTEEVLELACGTGQLTYLLAGRCATLTASDFAENMVAEARRHDDGTYPILRFCVQDATVIGFPEASFDAVVIANALHIMPEPRKALEEIHRVLRPGGKLYAPTFVLHESGRFHVLPALFSLFGFRAYHRWTEKELVAEVESAGFRVTSHQLLPSGISRVCQITAIKKESPLITV